MAQISKTFRIFVSSTFSDLKAERNALQERVFPKLRELCLQHGCRFQAIDLRWGVSEEAARDQQTMNICLQELERCQSITPRPNFIVLLGDRYGWRPLPPQIEAQEFEAILSKVSPQDKELLLWDEKQPSDRKGGYRKDDNAVPSEYCLRPREVAVSDNATDEEKKTAQDKEAGEWEQTERKLRSAILRAINQLGWPRDDPPRTKYEASATHQEILHGALGVPDAREHVYCFFRKLEGLPQDPRARDFVDLDETEQVDNGACKQLESLKQNLRRRLPGNIFEYKARWKTSSITTDHLNKLCDDVYHVLSRVIIKEIAALEKADALEEEIHSHYCFGEERARFFTGRASILRKIDDFLRENDSYPLAIFGVSGSGKTALMTYAGQRACQAHPGAEVVVRFIGATPPSSDGRALLESLCRQISRCYGGDESTIPTEYRQLVQEFPKRLALATKQKPLILFLDALDQLSDADHARSLSWLPVNLSANVRLIVSCLPGECLSVLQRKLPVKNLVELEPMPPEEGRKLLSLWLEDAGRTLQAYQRDEVLSKFQQGGLPLYLRLAFEEARRWKSYSEKIELSPDIPGVIRNLLGRLALDANHGKIMVSRSLGYLATAKNGLSEDELLDVLSFDEEVLRDFVKHAYHEPPEKKLPVVVWSRLYFDLKPYLTERTADGTSLMVFFHRQFGEAVDEEFLAGEARKRRHEGLAQYFGSQPLWIEKDAKKTANLRKVSELPYQQTYGDLWDELEETLCDLYFIETKCAAGMTYDLMADFASALDVLPEAQEEKQARLKHEERVKKYTEDLIAFAKGDIPYLDIIPSVEPWSDEKIREDSERIINAPTRLDRVRVFAQFVNSESHGLVKFGAMSGFCLQQAYNSANSGIVASLAEGILSNTRVDGILLLHFPSWRPEYNPHPAVWRTLEGHTGKVKCVSITPDGKRVISGGGAFPIPGWGEYTEDYAIRLWDGDTGECLRTLQGHTGPVESVSITPDGRRAISVGWHSDVLIWDLETGNCVRRLGEHTRLRVTAVSLSADGKKAVSGGGDKTLRVWDVGSGQCLRTLNTGSIRSLSITLDGSRAIALSQNDENRNLQVWDIVNGRCLKTMRVGSFVTSVSITPDGSKAISASGSTLQIWDLDSGTCLKTLEGPPGEVNGVSVTPDGRIAVSVGGYDNTLRVWDLARGQCLRVLEGHTSRGTSVAIAADGKRAFSASEDHTLRVWNIESGKCMRTLEQRVGSVYGTSVTADGKRAVSVGQDRSLQIWNIESGERIKRLTGHMSSVYGVSVTPDEKKAISGGGDRAVFVWDLESGKRLKILGGHNGPIRCVATTPDGRRAVSGSEDFTLRVWDMENGSCLKTIRPAWDVTSVSITPDGKIGVSGSRAKKDLQRWDIERGEFLGRFGKQHTHRGVNSVRTTPDGRRVVSGSDDGAVWVWDLRSGSLLRTLQGHTHRVTTVSITPDGQRAASGSRDGSLRVWDLKTGECLAGYQTPSGLLTISQAGPSGCFLLGTTESGLTLVKSSNFPAETPVVTSVRIWLHEMVPGGWDHSITATCQWCGQRFPVSDEILNVIKAITRDTNLSPNQSPCLKLPSEAWEEPRLLSKCPLCHKPLKFNPFVVDNRDRY